MTDHYRKASRYFVYDYTTMDKAIVSLNPTCITDRHEKNEQTEEVV
jgi:hypothetical protein